jgi:FAD/FMN-containing dehydrogenase
VIPSGFRGAFRTDLLARAVYAEGAGIARALPRAVAVPRDAEDAAALAAWAGATRTPLIPRGSGSGMAGGAVGEGVIVDLSRLREVGDVVASARRVRVGAGVLRGEVDARARGAGLRFPVDPSSGAFATVGGMAATNAAGARSLRFGAMRAWVVSLDCVFADGSRATVRRGGPLPLDVPALVRLAAELPPAAGAGHERAGVRKESSGYALADYARTGDLVDLLVGSEGTLALFVAVELALAPLPGGTSSALAAFPTLEAAVEGAARAREAGASACELLDRTFLDVVAQGGDDAHAPAGGYPALPAGSEAVLLMEVEGEDAAAAAALARRLGDDCATAGATAVMLALDAVTEARLWALRHAASPILSRLDPSLKSMQFIEDGCVPPERLPAYVRGVRRALEARGIRGVIFGHAGDANIHVNPLVDVRRPDWRARVREVLEEVAALTTELGGTLAGEHGDGRLRAPLLPRAWPAASLAAFAAVKRCFDPDGILNPGVKLPLDGQDPLASIKYDPALAPLPAGARAALAAVERERGYARFRLELLEGTR